MAIVTFSYPRGSITASRLINLRNLLPGLVVKHFSPPDWPLTLTVADVDVRFDELNDLSLQRNDFFLTLMMNRNRSLEVNFKARSQAFLEEVIRVGIFDEGRTIRYQPILVDETWTVVSTSSSPE